MKLFGRYLFRQTAGALLLILLSLTGVVWIATALKSLDVVTTEGHQAWQFFKITLLALPNLMVIIAPVALLIAALHTLSRLNNDSELIVMTASGATIWYFARPLVLLATLVSLCVLVFNLYVMPWSARTLNDMFAELRTDLIGQVLQPGRFSSPEAGLTIHIRERDTRTGQIQGLIMHDSRDPAQFMSYLAERGDILKDGANAYLVMNNGHIIRRTSGELSAKIIQFERYVVDLVRFKPKDEAVIFKPRERYLGELLSIDAQERAKNPQFFKAAEGKFRAELHDRLSSPLYPLAFVLIVLAGVGQAQTTRQNRVNNLIAAFSAATATRLLGFAAINLLSGNATLVPLVYAIPLGASLIACVIALYRARPRRQTAAGAHLEAFFDTLSQAIKRRFQPKRTLQAGMARRRAAVTATGGL